MLIIRPVIRKYDTQKYALNVAAKSLTKDMIFKFNRPTLCSKLIDSKPINNGYVQCTM